MQKQPLIAIVLLLLTSMACQLSNDVKNAVDTVDQASALLREISDKGTWRYVTKGLDVLKNQTEGYQATVQFQEGPGTPATGYSGTLSRDVTVALQVDGQNDMLANVTTGGQTQQFFVDGIAADATMQSNVYLLQNGRYACVSDAPEAQIIRNGIDGVFAEYGDEAAGLELLSIAEYDDDVDVAGRTTNHYQLESRINEALDLLDKFDSGELRSKVEAAGQFELSGDLYIDQETEALMRLNATYAQVDTQRLVTFGFEITQWGGIPDIPDPTADLIDRPCP
jgi:hypothetical protein